MATHSNILAWKIPWTEEPDGLQSTGSQRVRRDWAQVYPLSAAPLSLCKSRLLSSIIFLLPEKLLLTFLSGLIHWEQIPSRFICLTVLLLHC